ncbi:MAG: GtrA family protein [Pseudomonadota bacterium]
MRQLIRYGMVGIITNAIIYFVYLIMTCLGISPKISMTLLYLTGAMLGFIGHRKWSFTHEGDVSKSAFRYLIAHSLGYLVNFIILLIFVDRLGYSHQLVQATAIIVVAGFLFVTFRYFVFSALLNNKKEQ